MIKLILFFAVSLAGCGFDISKNSMPIIPRVDTIKSLYAYNIRGTDPYVGVLKVKKGGEAAMMISTDIEKIHHFWNLVNKSVVCKAEGLVVKNTAKQVLELRDESGSTAMLIWLDGNFFRVMVPPIDPRNVTWVYKIDPNLQSQFSVFFTEIIE